MLVPDVIYYVSDKVRATFSDATCASEKANT